MKRFLTFALILFSLALHTLANDNKKEFVIFGVAFYNLENLFDTINDNGKYDLEFSPQGSRKWDSEKYWSKIDRKSVV